SQPMESHSRQPIAVLGVMHGLLADCLPEGVYVEVTLSRFQPDGEVAAASAGGGRVVVKSKSGKGVTQLTLKGFWLGLAPPDPSDQHRFTLDPGDEVLLGSDGLFYHLSSGTTSENDLTTLVARYNGCRTLFETVRSALEESLLNSPQ